MDNVTAKSASVVMATVEKTVPARAVMTRVELTEKS